MIKQNEHIYKFFEYIQKEKINFWLDSGTLLKAYKSNFKLDAILNSSDLDFGFFYKDYKKIIEFCKKIEKKGFRVKLQTGYPFFEDIIKIYFPSSKKNEISHVDLYIYKKKKNFEYYRRCINKPFKKSLISRFINFIIFFLSIKRDRKLHHKLRDIFLSERLKNYFLGKIIQFYIRVAKTIWVVVPEIYFRNFKKVSIIHNTKKFTVKIPTKTKKYLGYRYGDLWNTQRKNWRPSDGSYLRIRKLNYVKSLPINVKKLKHDFIFYKPKSKERNFRFNFSDKEIIKIYKNEE